MMMMTSRTARFVATRVASRYILAKEDEALDLIIDRWTDAFLDGVTRAPPSLTDIEHALKSGGLTADKLNKATGADEARLAGFGEWITALGGKILKGAWHMITGPFHAVWKLLKSSSYRAEIKKRLKRVVRHEMRATKHMFSVAQRLVAGEKPHPQEVKVAARQFVDIATKVLLGVIVGPHLSHMFAAGPLKFLMSMLSPLDEVAGVVLDKPIRYATEKLLGEAIGLLPSGFYTHF